MKTAQVHLIIGTTSASLLVELQWYANQNKIGVGFLKITFYSFEKVTGLLDKKVCVFLSLLQNLWNLLCSTFFWTRLELKAWSPCKSQGSQVHVCWQVFLSFPRMPGSSHSCHDRIAYSYFARNVCNRYVDSFKTSIATMLCNCYDL